MLEAPKWGQVLFICQRINIVKAFTEGAYILGRVWAFGHELGAEFVEINLLSVFAYLYPGLKLLRNGGFVFTEIVLRFGDVSVWP